LKIIKIFLMEKLVKDTLAGLKDFQIKSVEHLFDQLYINGKQRVLLADEVGLGKTIVAKGIIAKAFQHYLNTANRKVNETFNVIYICSNQALAKQNIAKLNFTKDVSNVDTTVDRLIHLARASSKTNKLFLIQALTPSISFENRGNYGEVNERAIIFNLITSYDVFNPKTNKRRFNGLYKMLQGKAGDSGWQNAVYKVDNQNLQNELYNRFRKCLMQKIVDETTPNALQYLKNKEISVWHLLTQLSEEIDGRNIHLYKFTDEIVRLLRKELTKLCIKYLGADIFILDEFQRFSQILKLENEETDNQAIEIAKAIFADPDAKTLLLSATPFKPYTSGYDHINGEVHQKEFDDVLKFLLNLNSNDKEWQELVQTRKSFFNYLINPKLLADNFQEAIAEKDLLESKYFEVMLRTEKLLASEDNNALLKDVMNAKDSEHEGIKITIDDIEDFVAIDQLTLYLNENLKSKLPIPVEYVKSCPFALSFLQDYQHHKNLISALATSDKELLKLLKETKNLWLNTKAIDAYKNLLPSNKLPNAKIRLLTEDAIGSNGWKLLWIPPTTSYYNFDGAYKNSTTFSKTIVFSAWQMVPRMIAALLSYEVERKSFANIDHKPEEIEKGLYFTKGKRRKPEPLLVFPFNDDGSKLRLTNFILKYPCVYLAKCFDPLQEGQKSQSKQQVLKIIEAIIKPKIVTLITKYGSKTSQIHSSRWLWALPILLDKEYETAEIAGWLNSGNSISDSIIEADDIHKSTEDSKGEKGYLQLAKDLFNGVYTDLPFIEDENKINEIVNFIAKLCIGSASVCALRTMQRLPIDKNNLVDAAYEIGNSFITLFNKPESIAVVRNTKKDDNYVEEVLDYSINGNIQAMLDEYGYMLMDAENLNSCSAIATHIAEILSVRTSAVKIDDYNTIRTINKTNAVEKNMRCHYAVNFGGSKLVAGKTGKEINVRQAFNSPFRPFVLASTSIGQEGLDFHLYCRKVFHWNLPHNPIDFEQREGRINRYKSHVIRQNLVSKYNSEVLLAKPTEYWNQLFSIAEKEKDESKTQFKSDLVPYWHTETKDDIKIERFVPLLPFSRDIDKYKNLLKILTYYRLTFGQARQDELIDALNGEIDKDLFNKLLINLSSLNLRESAK
jgi:hypothetical protein